MSILSLDLTITAITATGIPGTTTRKDIIVARQDTTTTIETIIGKIMTITIAKGARVVGIELLKIVVIIKPWSTGGIAAVVQVSAIGTARATVPETIAPDLMSRWHSTGSDQAKLPIAPEAIAPDPMCL